MGEENKVIVHGMWASSYSLRVTLALRIKGIPYEYVEEDLSDLSNKSPSLLKYNPVRKKIPILIHNGKPIAESFIILEYIDEAWKNEPRLLPDHPHERAKVRFWASYLQQLLESLGKTITSDIEAREKALEEVFKKFDVVEEGMKGGLFPSGAPLIQGGFLDVVMAALFGTYRAREEALGIKIIDSERNPLIHSWITALVELPAVKEITPSHDKMVSLVRYLIQNNIKLTAP